MLKSSAKILLILIICLSFASCQSNERWRTFQERLRQEDVIRDAKLIREAQRTYQQTANKYGTMKDLIDADLIGSRFEDGEESDVMHPVNQAARLRVAC